ncbi:MAG: oligosaccharide flippase family protein [candidate division Zixibacteria bacterium]|nr:oligosaccharide flippase family protein [candidate division Zixibacteria bacterium]
MIRHLERLTRHSALYGLSDVLGRSLTFLLVPLYTHVMTTEAYGHVALIYGFIALMNVVFTFGMDAAFLRFYMLEETHRRQILSTALLTMTGVSFALAGGVAVAAPLIDHIISPSASLASYIRMAAVVLALDAISAVPFARLRGEGRAALFAALKLVRVALELAGNYWLVVLMGKGLEGILITNIAGSGLTVVALAFITLPALSLDWNRSRLYSLLKFGIPYIPAGACVIFIEMLDRFILERLTDTRTVGIYSAAHKLGVGMLIFVNMFRQAWQPFFLETSKNEDARPLFARILTYFLLIASTLGLSLSLLIDWLVRIPVKGITFFSSAYWEGIGVVPFFALAYILYGLYVNLTVGVYLKNKTAVLPIITGAAALTSVGANLWLIPIWGIYGAGLASVLAYGVMAGGLYITGRRHYPIPYEYGRIAQMALICGGLFTVGWLGTAPDAWAARLGLITAYPVLLALTGFFNTQEKQYVKRRLRLLLR